MYFIKIAILSVVLSWYFLNIWTCTACLAFFIQTPQIMVLEVSVEWKSGFDGGGGLYQQ